MSTQIPPKSPKDYAAALDGYGFRDEWIADVLTDLELSPTARMVGAYLGLSVDLDYWPSIPWIAVGRHHGTIAAVLGLPMPIVAKACDALMDRDWIRPATLSPRKYCYVLNQGVRS